MPDNVELLANGKRIDRFKSYEIERDMYTADAAFNIEIGRSDYDVQAGDRIALRLNGEIVMNGIVDRRTREYDKTAGRTRRIMGRSIMGIVVDSYCEEFSTLKNKTIGQVARIILTEIPYAKRAGIVFADNASSLDVSREFTQLEPGMRAFDVLAQCAISRGLLFYERGDGTLVFGRPKGRGETAFSMIVKDGVNESKIKSAILDDNIASRYSKVTVIGQQQGADNIDASEINILGSATDDDYPFYKPYVEVLNEDAETPKKRARMILERMRVASHRVTYTVSGHSQAGKIFDVDQLCAVNDEELGIQEDLLVYSLSMTMNKDVGQVTTLRLGRPGVAG